MTRFSPCALAFFIGITCATTWAAEKDDHDVHHPEATVSSSKAPKKAPKNVPPSKAAIQDSMNKMEVQMKVMQEMHEKMMSAKTPEERNALMGDHMKAMQGGMSMMKDMGGMDGKGSKDQGMRVDMVTRQQMMEKRMDMMETTMQMMMDRLPAIPSDK